MRAIRRRAVLVLTHLSAFLLGGAVLYVAPVRAVFKAATLANDGACTLTERVKGIWRFNGVARDLIGTCATVNN